MNTPSEEQLNKALELTKAKQKNIAKAMQEINILKKKADSFEKKPKSLKSLSDSLCIILVRIKQDDELEKEIQTILQTKEQKANTKPTPIEKQIGDTNVEKVPKGSRADFKANVIQLLKDKSPNALSTQELAALTGKPLGNISVWLATTGKKVPEIVKVGRGLYTYKATETIVQEPTVEPPVEVQPTE